MCFLFTRLTALTMKIPLQWKSNLHKSVPSKQTITHIVLKPHILAGDRENGAGVFVYVVSRLSVTKSITSPYYLKGARGP